jgi:V8-like Glu-specific endopeptidase
MNGNSCYVFIQETNTGNMSLNSLIISGVVGGVQPVDGDAGPSSRTMSANARVSNSCVPSIRCFEDWMLTARAVSRWSNGAGSACSGTLLNNEKGDGTGYYYSAHHCLPTSVSDLRYASFQFQYWQTGCNTGVDQPYIEFYGATLLNEVGYNDGDAILLKLNSGPGVGDGPTYAGWNRNSSAPSQSQSAIIHHPQAGDMRFTSTRRVRNFLWDSDFWKASYSTGVMLPGSSGSALFNENKQVIGTLSRGLSSCFWYFLGDRFGKFDRGWTGMQQYLSPVQNIASSSALVLYQLAVTGNTTVGCTTGPEIYSVPNLAGCTFTWTTSPNLSIQSGQGTNRVTVFFATGSQPSDYGWVNVVISDSKGSFPNGRRLEIRKDLTTTNSNPLAGTYSTNAATKTLQTVNFVPTGNIYVQYQWPGATNIVATLAPGSPSGSGFSAFPGRFSFNIFNGQTITVNLTGNGACGPVSATRTFIQSSYSSFAIKASPNPASGTVNVSISRIEVADSSGASSLQSAVSNTTEFSLYDATTNVLVKKWKYKENVVSSDYNLNIAGIKSGYYVLKMEREKRFPL